MAKYKASFVMEIKQCGGKKTASSEMVYRLVMDTDDKQLLELGALPSDQTVKVTVEAEV